MEFLHNLLQVRETTLLSLGEDEAAIHRYLEATASAWDQGQALDTVAVPVKKLLRRPGGSKEVVSGHAVLDLNGQFLGHSSLLSSCHGPLLQHMLAPPARGFNHPYAAASGGTAPRWPSAPV